MAKTNSAIESEVTGGQLIHGAKDIQAVVDGVTGQLSIVFVIEEKSTWTNVANPVPVASSNNWDNKERRQYHW